jgi:hypothetical protein
MGRLRVRIKDKRICALVKAFLKAGVLTDLGDREETLTGTPQGSLCEAEHNPPLGYLLNRSRAAVYMTEPAGQATIPPCRADSGGRALTCAAPVT